MPSESPSAPLSALVKELVNLRALHPNQLKRQAAVFVDPLADILRINPQQLLGDERECAGMESECCVRRDANVLARKITGQQGASGRTEAGNADVDLLCSKLLPFLLV